MKDAHGLPLFTLCGLLLLSPGIASAEEEAPNTGEPALTLDPHLQYRPRIEKTFMGNISGRPANGNFRPTHRARVWLDGSYDFASARVMVQDVRIFGSEGSTVGDFSADGIDMHEGWIQLGRTTGIKAGRQEINVNGQRLLGAVDWLQQAQSFDGLILFHNGESFGGRALWLRVPNGGLNDLFAVTPYASFSGFELTVPLVLQTNEMVEIPNRGARTEDWTRFTGGAYVVCKSACGKANARIEGYAQKGTNALAGMVGVRAGYALHEYFKPTLWIDFVSGDDPQTANRTEAFDTLFGTNHKFYGLMDRFLNLPVDTRGGGLIDVALKIDSELPVGTLHTEVHYFNWARETAAGDAGAIGIELDIIYTYRFNSVVGMQAGASWFADVGDFAGPGRDSHDWFYIQADIKL